jgi:hypothetical protein
MFVYKQKVYEIKKVTFGNAERVMLFVMALQPTVDGNHIHLKQKNKKVFHWAVRGLIDTLIENFPKIRRHKSYMFVLTEIIKATSLHLIVDKFNKQMEAESKEVIHKSDYIQRFMSDVRRAVMPYGDLTTAELESIGFLELEEYVAELQKREIRRQQTFMNNLLTVVGCVLSKKGGKDFEKTMRDMNKMYRELDNIGFDEVNYVPDLMEATYGK